MSPSSAKTAGGGGESPRLTREQIVERIRRWHALYGEAPVTADWNPSIARWRAQEWRIPRYQAGDPDSGEPWPSLNAVKRRFDGSFDAAVRLAGLEPRRPGPPRKPGIARPAAAPRTQPPASLAERLAAELESTGRQLRAAEARATEAERGLRDARRRERRLRRQLDEARARARRFGDRARRARSIHPSPSPSVRSVTTGGSEMTLGEGGGPGRLAAALRRVAGAHAEDDGAALRLALDELAGTAESWRARL